MQYKFTYHVNEYLYKFNSVNNLCGCAVMSGSMLSSNNLVSELKPSVICREASYCWLLSMN